MSKNSIKKTGKTKNYKFFRSSQTLKYLKIEQTLKLSATLAVSFLLAFSISELFIPASNSFAISPDEVSGTSTAPVSVSVSNSPLAYYISVSSSHGSTGTPVSFSYSQDGSSGSSLGNVVSSSDLVSIETNSPMSHQLLLSTTSPSSTTKSNNLTGTNTQESGGLPVANTYIAPVSGTTTSSLSTATALTGNTWGFAMSNTTPGIVANNFDADYSTTTNSSKFATVPSSGNEVLLTEDTTGTSNTTIYYGVLADRDIPAGSYSNTILYTALAEQPSEIRVSPSTVDMASPFQTLTVYTSINTTQAIVSSETATIKFYQTENSSLVEKGACSSPTVNLDGDNFLYVTCTTPVLSAGNYTIELTLNNLGRVLSQTNGITYSGNPLDNIETMQTFTQAACDRLPEADTKGNNIYTLKDSRDNKSYKIAHLKDGNCWMVQNLALDGGRTLHPSDSNVTQDRVLPINITNGEASKWNNLQIVSSFSEYIDNNGNVYGNLYNWDAATVGTSTGDDPAGIYGESVCPYNWHMPNTFFELMSKYINGLINGSNNISADAMLNILKLPLGISLAGSYYNSWRQQNSYGYYWTRTRATYNDYTGAQFMDIQPLNNNYITTMSLTGGIHGFSVRCVFGS